MIKHCTSCQLEKDINKFHLNKRTKDGYHGHCKSCRAEYTERYYSIIKSYKKINIIVKTCVKCELIKHSNDYHKSRGAIDGLQPRCKACESLRFRKKVKTKYCPGCKNQKDIKEFNKHENRRDGLQPYCKLCKKEIALQYYYNNMSYLKIKIIVKKCYICGVLKNAHDFYKHKRTADGLQATCKACESLRVRK